VASMERKLAVVDDCFASLFGQRDELGRPIAVYENMHPGETVHISHFVR
jgi:hypothetical protein